MNDLRQGWLVARREMRERSRSPAFYVGLALMLLVVVAAIVVPSLLEENTSHRDVGIVGTAPEGLTDVLTSVADAGDLTVDVHRYDAVAPGEEAVRSEAIDVLIVGGDRLVWLREPDATLRAVIAASIQRIALEERAGALGLPEEEMSAIIAPVSLEDVEIGTAAGVGPQDETAATVMAILLLMAITTYGNLVLTGVVEEKASRVVEVLLARMPARNLLAGKVAGIGLLGLGQFVVTAVAALAAAIAVDSVDIPAIRASVLAWVVAWFVLGYALYAMAYGALGSLASRTEDAQSAAGPAIYVLLAAFWASLVVVARDPSDALSRFVSLFPPTAPFAMPSRIALGTAEWWEPPLAAAFAVLAIAGLVALAGRVYTGGILQLGAKLSIREAWRRASTERYAQATPRDATGGRSHAGGEDVAAPEPSRRRYEHV